MVEVEGMINQTPVTILIVGYIAPISMEVLVIRIIFGLIVLKISVRHKILFLLFKLIIIFLSFLVGQAFFLPILLKTKVSLPHSFLQSLWVIIFNSIFNMIW